MTPVSVSDFFGKAKVNVGKKEKCRKDSKVKVKGSRRKLEIERHGNEDFDATL